MSALLGVIADEPAAIMGLVSAVLVLLVAFGVPLTEEEGKAVTGLFAALLMLAGALYVRSKSTPNTHVDAIVRTVQAPAPAPGPEAVGQ